MTIFAEYYDTTTGDPVDDDYMADLTRDYLNEYIDPLTIGHLIYLAGDSLEKLDPIAFRQAVLEDVDALLQDGRFVHGDDVAFWRHRVWDELIAEGRTALARSLMAEDAADIVQLWIQSQGDADDAAQLVIEDAEED